MKHYFEVSQHFATFDKITAVRGAEYTRLLERGERLMTNNTIRV